MHRTPTEKLRITAACLDAATEGVAQVHDALNHVQRQQPAHLTFLTQTRTKVILLKNHLLELEQQLASLIPSDQNGRRGP